MKLLENPIVKYLARRFKEPSSWAALGTLLLGVGVLNPGAYQKYVMVVGGIMSVLGFAMPENAKPTAPPLPPAVAPSPNVESR
jgi:hypothetical protein